MAAHAPLRASDPRRVPAKRERVTVGQTPPQTSSDSMLPDVIHHGEVAAELSEGDGN
jgi:hypothetical protein